MKIYIVMVDLDQTMRSSPEPAKIFSKKEKADEYLKVRKEGPNASWYHNAYVAEKDVEE